MTKTLNIKLRDAILRHLIDLHRYANHEVKAMLDLLNKTDVKLFNRLVVALSKLSPDSFTVKRLDSLLHSVWSVNEAAYRQLATNNDADMKDLTEYELKFQERLFRDLLPNAIDVKVPNLKTVWAVITARPLQGRLMGEWFQTLGQGRQIRIQDTLRSGYITGQTVNEMTTEVRELINIDRRHAEAVVRTATAGTAAVAREEFYSENADIIKAEQWLSTLDNRTTELCMARDSHQYSVGDHRALDNGPPWDEGPGQIHWNCRSTSVPVINSAEILGIKLPPVERAAMNGVAAPNTTYAAWLKDQTAEMQDDILGSERGRMYRSGDVSFTKFFNDSGKMLTLEELRTR